MYNQAFSSVHVKYQSADDSQHIYRQIRDKAILHFAKNNNNRRANRFFWIKTGLLTAMAALGYGFILNATGLVGSFLGYFIFGFPMLLISMNIGHDAAHHAVTGNSRIDDRLFRFVFALQGLSGYLWQIRHNHSHHVLPNVHEHDSDLELGGIIILDRHDCTQPIHRYQHFYAPFLYLFATLILFVYQDYEMLNRKAHGNLRIGRIPADEWVRFALAKVVHLGLYIGIPVYFGVSTIEVILPAFLLMHFALSLFMMFTFVISHHVEEVPYVTPISGNIINDAWVRHQVVTTIDFNEKSKFANFIFGGFNLHVAHHLFPEVSHVHYPVLTNIIRETLAENGCADWYKSFSFWEGCCSHLRHLRNIGQQGYAEVPDLRFLGWPFSKN